MRINSNENDIDIGQSILICQKALTHQEPIKRTIITVDSLYCICCANIDGC